MVMLLLKSNVFSTARIFITTKKWLLDDHYPPMPTNTGISYDIIKSHHSEFNDGMMVRVKWDIPRKIRELKPNSQINRYRFCAVVSRRQPDWTICDELGENLESIHCVNQSVNTLEIDNMRVGSSFG